MYESFCSRKENNFKLEALDFTPGNSGGFKTISFTIKGTNPYGLFKYESGAHRVQRVPKTESKGRVHTSIATVTVLPEVKVEDIQINKADVKVEPYNSGGKGGQHSNKTLNACRLTHTPSGIQASSQLKSYPQNLKLAWAVLATRIKDHQLNQQTTETASKKKELRGQGSNADKVQETKKLGHIIFQILESQITELDRNTLYKAS
jgi:peptide chain release factor 1